MSTLSPPSGLEAATGPVLPRPRGPLSGAVLEMLTRRPGRALFSLPPSSDGEVVDPLRDDDFALALYVLYELHYRSFAGVAGEWEWNPGLLAFRAELESRFEEAILRDLFASPTWEICEADPATHDPARAPAEIPRLLRAMIDSDPGPSLSRRIETTASRDQVLEFLVHRSAYQLKEADPHSWALPRLSGRPKAALIEIQADEYGGGDADYIHAHLFAQSMQAAGLDEAYGAYLDRLPGSTLSSVNLMSFFGLHRRWRGAIAGHLAVFEMTSSVPNRRYGNGLRRLGFPQEALAFFDEHVEADAVHENIAAHDLAAGLARDEGLGRSILIGAGALVRADARFARDVLEAWDANRSSLLSGPPELEAE